MASIFAPGIMSFSNAGVMRVVMALASCTGVHPEINNFPDGAFGAQQSAKNLFLMPFAESR